MLISSSLTIRLLSFQVECKKAQPKEVMLPANLAKTRAAGRGAYGELLMLQPGSVLAAAAAPGPAHAHPSAAHALRYAPYPLPSAATAHAQAVPLAAIAVAAHHAPLHYVYDMTAGCKRVLAAPAATLRPLAASRAPPALAYSMSDLLQIQGLDLPAAVYANHFHAAGLGI